ncbi:MULTISPECIES: hypothetical protein [Spirulina sp. CCY15215]|uniref:hypothetical protein n=1 Tax=Spirulina sp. CCY15215 TaxID=2767591 RepID=UPI001950CC14|nr:hypothetical protein [Spirulina major]
MNREEIIGTIEARSQLELKMITVLFLTNLSFSKRGYRTAQLAEMFGYSTQLRSLSSGMATFSMEL